MRNKGSGSQSVWQSDTFGGPATMKNLKQTCTVQINKSHQLVVFVDIFLLQGIKIAAKEKRRQTTIVVIWPSFLPRSFVCRELDQALYVHNPHWTSETRNITPTMGQDISQPLSHFHVIPVCDVIVHEGRVYIYYKHEVFHNKSFDSGLSE